MRLPSVSLFKRCFLTENLTKTRTLVTGCHLRAKDVSNKKFDISMNDLLMDENLKTDIRRPTSKIDLEKKIKVVKEKRSVEENMRTLQTRELRWIEKVVLVRIGRFESMDEVPDKMKYNTYEEMQRDKEVTLTLLKENGFKMFSIANYGLWLLTGCAVGFYYYQQYDSPVTRQLRDGVTAETAKPKF